jgi:transposase
MSPGNIVGVDPHRRSLTATVLDERGGVLGHGHFDNTKVGYSKAIAWAGGFGPIDRWGVENAGSLGRHLAEFLVAEGSDVRDVPPHRTARRGRGRHEGKSDVIDAQRAAQETQTNPQLACAFKRATPDAPDSLRDRIALWHNARKSLTKVRVQLLGEVDMLIHDLPEDVRCQVTTAKTVRAKINAFVKINGVLEAVSDPVVRLRISLIAQRVTMLRDVLAQDKTATAELAKLVGESRSTLTELVGIAPRAAAEILVEVGDVRRFTEAGFARYNGTAPVPASSGEGSDQPVRHRLSRGGNRRLNTAIHRIAMIQLRFEPRARILFDNARDRGHTRREAMRILKRHLSDVIYRTMLRDSHHDAVLT